VKRYPGQEFPAFLYVCFSCFISDTMLVQTEGRQKLVFYSHLTFAKVQKLFEIRKFFGIFFHVFSTIFTPVFRAQNKGRFRIEIRPSSSIILFSL